MRKCNDFISSWVAYMQPLPTPSSFALWAGLGAISAALSRKVWIRANSRLPPCYPNLYLMLVGNPGMGKDIAINKASWLLNEASARQGSPIACLGPESISPKGLVDRLSSDKAKQIIHLNGQLHEIQSLTFCIGELGTAISEYDPKLIPFLNDLYNCKDSFTDAIRGLDVEIKNPHLTLILGNQPATLSEVFPEKTFRMGFTSRILFIYESARPSRDLFYDDENGESAIDTRLEENLIHDIIQISKLTGAFKVSPAVKRALNDFNHSEPKKLTSTRFLDYNSRRILHLQKLAEIYSISESDSMEINESHFNSALECLFNAESRMESIFETVTTSAGFSHVYEELLEKLKKKKEVTHRELTMFLSRTQQPHVVKGIIESMLRDGYLIQCLDEAGAPAKPNKYRFTNA